MRSVIPLRATPKAGYAGAWPGIRRAPAWHRPLPSARAVSAAATIIAVLAIVATFLAAVRHRPSQTLADTATLTIVSGTADVRPRGASGFSAARDGQIVRAGDVVQTGAGGRVVVTYFEGSSIGLGPSTTSAVGRLNVLAAGEPAAASAPASQAGEPPSAFAWERLTHLLGRGVAAL